jgi:hypothetical protein
MRIKETHCLTRLRRGVCSSAAVNRRARAAEGQVDGGLSFSAFLMWPAKYFSQGERRHCSQGERRNMKDETMDRADGRTY